MKNKTGKVIATSASVLVSLALTLGLAPASQAAPLAPAVTASVATKIATPTAVQSDPWASQTLSIINRYRADRGLAPLAWNQQIADVSQGWAAHLGEATKSPIFSWANIHRSDAGGSLIPRGATWYREVVVFSFTPQKSVDWWMNSPGHRDAIMSPKATHIGIGHVTPGSGPYAGWNQMVANLASYPTAPSGSTTPVAAPAPSADAVTGTAKTTYDVNFRSGPSTGYTRIDVVPQGSTVNLHGGSVNGWNKVTWNGKTGYISSGYLTAVTANHVPAPAPAPAPAPSASTAKATTNVNFRAGASTNTGIIQVIPQGATVQVLSPSIDGWTKISYNGRTGYIYSIYLTGHTPASKPAGSGIANVTTNVNFRSGASTNTGIIQVIPYNAQVNVLSASVNGWTNITYNGRAGYIYSIYLTPTR